MIIAGAQRHAVEVYDIYNHQEDDNLSFFDDVNEYENLLFHDTHPIIQDIKKVTSLFLEDNRFILGLGGTKSRKIVAEKLTKVGGCLISIVAQTAQIGLCNTSLAEGLNVMHNVLISSNVKIGQGCLINAYASIHHHVQIGEFCEISPRATLLGGVKVGSFCSLGAGCIVLPDVVIGNNVVIGAGSVVTKNIADNSIVMGVPGKIINK